MPAAARHDGPLIGALTVSRAPPSRAPACFGARLEREMIERVRHPEPVVDPGVVVRRYARHAPRFHEGDELIAPGVEEDVADLPAFLDPEGVATHRLELQDVLVEVTRPVEIQCREADVREPLVRHRGPSFQPSTRL